MFRYTLHTTTAYVAIRLFTVIISMFRIFEREATIINEKKR